MVSSQGKDVTTTEKNANEQRTAFLNLFLLSVVKIASVAFNGPRKAYVGVIAAA